MKPTFKNRPNQCVLTEDRQELWVSRACAVVGHVCLYDVSLGQWFVLLGKRGEGTPDFQGYWGLPCGYLDWDESLCDALLREVWEECGLYLPSLSDSAQYAGSRSRFILQNDNFDEQPWYISDRPGKNAKQNISFHYACLFAWKSSEYPALSDAYSEPNEVAGIEWTPLNEVMTMELAFNHGDRIKNLVLDHSDKFTEIETLGVSSV